MKEFYIVLPSNASMNLYPDNKLSTFTVRLPSLQELDETWRVGLAEISFTKSWNNLQGNNTIVLPNVQLNPIQVPTGNYETPQTLIEGLNKLMKDKWAHKHCSPPRLTIVNDLVMVLNAKVHSERMDPRVERKPNQFTEVIPKFSKNLEEILGIGKSRPSILNQGYSHLYVYSDIVFPSLIGDMTGKLLRVVDVPDDAHFGANVTHIFDKPYYYKLLYTSFNEISIKIRTDTGIAPYFNFGRVVVTLHFCKNESS